MSEFTLRSVDKDGKIVHENGITIVKGDKLILKYPPDATLEQVERVHKIMVEAFEKDKNVITIPNIVDITVIKVR